MGIYEKVGCASNRKEKRQKRAIVLVEKRVAKIGQDDE
jgi:hypothetical protein